MTLLYTNLNTSNQTINCIVLGKYNSLMSLLTSECTIHIPFACEKDIQSTNSKQRKKNSTSSKTVPTGTPVQLYGKCFARRYHEDDLKSTALTTADRQYTFFTSPFVPRNIAKDICGLSGSYLLEINSQAEWDSLLIHAPSGLFYTGATDAEDRGVFKWETAGQRMTFLYTSLYTNNRTIDCIVLGKYNSLMSLLTSECTIHIPFACEKEIQSINSKQREKESADLIF